MPHLLEHWPVEGDLVVPIESLPPNLLDSTGGAWRHKQKNLKLIEEQQ
jgi:ribonuclease Z